MNQSEKLADEFDCDLYRLIVRAERHGSDTDKANKRKWLEVVQALRPARRLVREMMDDKTRGDTIG